MCHYRFYIIGKDGHVDGPPASHDEPDDFAAIAKARQLLDGHDIEIWEAQRLVAYVVPGESDKGWLEAE